MAYSRLPGTKAAEMSFVYKFGTTMAACSKLQLHLLENPDRKQRKIRGDLVDLVLACRSSAKEFRANFSSTDEVAKLGMFTVASSSLGMFMDVSSPSPTAIPKQYHFLRGTKYKNLIPRVKTKIAIREWKQTEVLRMAFDIGVG